MSTTSQAMRNYKGPRLFEKSFRPFFLSAGVFAAFAMPVWVYLLASGNEFAAAMSGRTWHVHEMLFGYLAAIIAGFLLTAVPNWTGRLPVVGMPLAVLWGLWLAGRLAMWFLTPWPALSAVVDGAFLVVLAGLLWREVIAGKNVRNIPVCVIVSLLALANGAFHYVWFTQGDTAFAQRLALGMVAILISLIGGRIVPSFTRNWMKKENLTPLPAGFDRIDKLGMSAGVAAILTWVATPEHSLTASLFIMASVIFSYRIFRWRGWACYREPLVLILHIGYAWLPAWFALMAVAIWFPGTISEATAIHALSAGAVGTMTIAVVTRASLGHSGMPLTANFMTSVLYGLIIAAAVLRISAEWITLDYTTIISVSGALWSIGFMVFVMTYGPMLLGRPLRFGRKQP